MSRRKVAPAPPPVETNAIAELLARDGYIIDDLKDGVRGPAALAVLLKAGSGKPPEPKYESLPEDFFSRSIPVAFNIRDLREITNGIEIVECRCVVYLLREPNGKANFSMLAGLLSGGNEKDEDAKNATEEQFIRFCNLLDPKREPVGFGGFPKDGRPLSERAAEYFGARRPFMDDIITEIFLYYRSVGRPTGLFREF